MPTVHFEARPTGPLDNHRNYLVHVALSNAVEYFDLVRAYQEQPRISSSEKYEEVRHFLNAIESMNNVPEYLYWEIRKPGVPEWRKFANRV
jgi:hypothetical protein